MKLKQFVNNSLSKEEQLGLRLYNLEKSFRKEFIVKNLMMCLAGEKYLAFDSDEWQCGGSPNEIAYIHSVQIVRYFGRDLVTRAISFLYREEVQEVNRKFNAA